MTELRALQHFATVYRSRSFRATAEALGMSQSAVTKSIQRLELELGVRLFNRTTRTVEPTDSARQLIGKAESTLQAVAAFDAEANLLARGELGAIRVGAIALAAETLIVNGLARLAKTHPHLQVEVVVGSSDVYRDLATGACDVVVGDEANFAGSPHSASLRKLPIHEEPLVLVHRSGHPGARVATMARLLEYPLAIPSRYFNENRLFEAISTRAEIGAVPCYRLNSLSACLALAGESDVVTLAPQSVADRHIQNRQPSTLKKARFATGMEIRLVLVTAAKSSPSPAVRAFQAAIS